MARFGKKCEISGIVLNKDQLLKQNRAACLLWGGKGSNNAIDTAPPPEILRNTAHASLSGTFQWGKI